MYLCIYIQTYIFAYTYICIRMYIDFMYRCLYDLYVFYLLYKTYITRVYPIYTRGNTIVIHQTGSISGGYDLTPGIAFTTLAVDWTWRWWRNSPQQHVAVAAVVVSGYGLWSFLWILGNPIGNPWLVGFVFQGVSDANTWHLCLIHLVFRPLWLLRVWRWMLQPWIWPLELLQQPLSQCSEGEFHHGAEIIGTTNICLVWKISNLCF